MSIVLQIVCGFACGWVAGWMYRTPRLPPGTMVSVVLAGGSVDGETVEVDSRTMEIAVVDMVSRRVSVFSIDGNLIAVYPVTVKSEVMDW